MENPDIDRPAVHIGFPFFAALFVASFFGAPFAAVSAVLLFAAVFLLFLFKQHRQRPNFVLSLIATAAAFAVFAVAMNLFVLPTERYDGGTYTVTGNVESFLTKSNGRFYYKLHVTHIDEPYRMSIFRYASPTARLSRQRLATRSRAKRSSSRLKTASGSPRAPRGLRITWSYPPMSRITNPCRSRLPKSARFHIM